MNKYLRNNRGSALLMSLCLLFMLTLIGIMALQNSNTDIDLAFNKSHSDKAFYIAEAGAKRAVVEIWSDPSWDAGFAEVSFAGGKYSVTITDSSDNSALDDTVIVTATGRLPDAASTVEIMLARKVSYPFQAALFGDDNVDLKNSMETDSYNSDSGTYASTQEYMHGDVGSNGTITVKNGAHVGGDVVTSQTGGATVHPGSVVTGSVIDDAPHQDIETIPQSEYDYAAVDNDNLTGISGSYSYDPSTYAFESTSDVVLGDGVYYFSSLILKNSASLSIAPGAQAIVYVTGDIEIKNSGDVNVDGDPADLIFYSRGDIVLKNSGELRGVFYSPGGSGDLRNSGDFYGSIVANDIIVHNKALFHYDRALSKLKKKFDGKLKQVAWQEIQSF